MTTSAKTRTALHRTTAMLLHPGAGQQFGRTAEAQLCSPRGRSSRTAAMKPSRYFLLLVLATNVCFGQASSPSQEKTVHPLPPLSDSTWRWVSATRAKEPLSVITITNVVSEDSVLTVTDRVNGRHGIDGFVDGYCGFGARLGRDYLGRGSLVTVSFAWDQRPKRTIISMYGTNAVAGEAWGRDITKALRERFGDE